jgi:Tfp pilus assembly protein PilO
LDNYLHDSAEYPIEMITILNMLNVRAEERRPVIIFLMCALVVGNLVWLSMEPGLLTLRSQLDKHEQELGREKMVQANHKEYKQKVAELNPKASVASGSEQAAKVLETLRREAGDNGITLTRNVLARSGTRKDNPFEEHKRNVTFETGLVNLVKFLQDVAGKEDSMIRVSDYKISPTGDRRRVQVQMSFVASYPKPNFGEEKSKKKKKR